jgi:hypothetical protein
MQALAPVWPPQEGGDDPGANLGLPMDPSQDLQACYGALQVVESATVACLALDATKKEGLPGRWRGPGSLVSPDMVSSALAVLSEGECERE